MQSHKKMCEAIVIGCGPYGLAATAHLRASGVETRIFGEPMKFWKENAPRGMMLRSSLIASDIGASAPQLTLSSFLKSRDVTSSSPLPVDSFIEYGHWVQQQVAPDCDQRRISKLTAAPDHFIAMTEDGEAVKARRIIVATGIADFTHRPEAFRSVTPAMVAHSSDPMNLRDFAGRRVAVVGSGQSAVESAALLSEGGADVELIMRTPRIRWLHGSVGLRNSLGPIGKLVFPWTDVGAPPLSQLVALPGLFRRLPLSTRIAIDRRTMRASVANWLVPRIARVTLSSSRVVRTAQSIGSQLELLLDDGSARRVDKVVLGTGFRIDIARLAFLTPELLATVKRVDGYPQLDSGFESSVPGLHFIGATAASSFGSLTRFVAGTGYTATALTHAVRYPARSWTPSIGRQQTAFN
jgi:cation diffusion facilitator CzcD-associated flavoprotein CzcO